jgi:competence protein ComEA
VDWLKNQWAQAKTGDQTARRKLLFLGVGLVTAVSLLISGQMQSAPIVVKASKKSTTVIGETSGFVHIGGAVKVPGVYPIKPGMRLFEVLTLAGGFSDKADRDSVNLARTVSDGEQILVSKAGESAVNDGLIHLNQATASDLDKLPGIGPTLAGRIIDWRNANQGFKAVEDLRKVGGIGDKLFAGLKSLVTL